ncbi:EAL domain-containing protein [uncultured Parvibaculum sp.]|uniref:EAL domain-containing protein n=1 Tax=uncultured Parvibaculum sp. TaxID=291828 RepID=UPI0030EDF2EF|tara:strand:+ start:21400 stop:22797 length:1398 start_codon:yes stop_codon:yes gene_type:complete
MYSSSFRLTNRDIDLAFEARHLFLVCQPKIALETGAALGAEAYIRWNHPDFGLLPPGLFLAFFERRERSGELTRYVASAAADAMVEWQAAGCDWPLSINLGAADLADRRLPGDLDGILGERGIDPSQLTLEVPEGAFARHGETAGDIIRELRRLGFRTALDGGGAVIVPDDVVNRDCFDEIKIGGTAIIQFAGRLRHAGLGFVGRRVALAASRGLEATAVGVEDETTLAALPALGFTAAQGAHICRPVPLAELTGWTAPKRRPVVERPAEPEATPGDDGAADEDVLLLTNPIEEEPSAIAMPAETPAPEPVTDTAPQDMAILQAEAATPEPPEPAAETAPDETMTLQVEPAAPEIPEEAPAYAAMPTADTGILMSWDELDFHVPGEEVRAVAWRIDRVCLSPDRHLVAKLRKPRSRKPRPAAAKPAPAKTAAPPAPAPRPRRIRRPRAPAGLVTRPSFVQLALGF